mgnify:CR=1 FL=1
MSQVNLKLELASYEYFDSFFQLKSEQGNIYWSGFSDVPNKLNLENHFCAAMESSSREFYLLLEDKKAIGYLYVDFDSKSKELELAYGISQHKNGRGLAKFMIKEGLSLTSKKAERVIAWVAASNIPSIKSVEALGFVKSSETDDRMFELETEPVKFYKYVKCSGNKL